MLILHFRLGVKLMGECGDEGSRERNLSRDSDEVGRTTPVSKKKWKKKKKNRAKNTRQKKATMKLAGICITMYIVCIECCKLCKKWCLIVWVSYWNALQLEH